MLFAALPNWNYITLFELYWIYENILGERNLLHIQTISIMYAIISAQMVFPMIHERLVHGWNSISKGKGT